MILSTFVYTGTFSRATKRKLSRSFSFSFSRSSLSVLHWPWTVGTNWPIGNQWAICSTSFGRVIYQSFPIFPRNRSQDSGYRNVTSQGFCVIRQNRTLLAGYRNCFPPNQRSNTATCQAASESIIRRSKPFLSSSLEIVLWLLSPVHAQNNERELTGTESFLLLLMLFGVFLPLIRFEWCSKMEQNRWNMSWVKLYSKPRPIHAMLDNIAYCYIERSERERVHNIMLNFWAECPLGTANRTARKG